MRANKLKWIFLSIVLFGVQSMFSQTTKVRGTITDAVTGIPIVFANVVFKTTNVGTLSDDSGKYFIETRNASDTIFVTILGYATRKFRIKKYMFQELNVKLEPTSTQLAEVVVSPGENPANILLRNIIKNKKKNNQDKMQSYECEVYNKLEFDISNIDSTFRQRKAFKPFQIIFDYVDTSAINGKSYLPVFLSETVSEYYSKKAPTLEREVIKGTKISGIDNESVSQFTGDMYLKNNIYDNYLDVFKKQFVSPISNVAALYYKYMIIDTAKFQNRTCYELSFKPKSRQEPTFTGTFWVQDSTFGIVKFNMRINEKANINYVNDMVFSNEFELQNDSIWVLKKEELFVEFSLSDKTFGVFGRKTTDYSKYVVNNPRPDEFYTALGYDKTRVTDDASKQPDAFWKDARKDNLTPKEANTYKMMDTLRQVPIFKNIVDLVKTLYTGYKVTKYFEFGPYYTFYSFNKIEGTRLRFGGRTSNFVSTKIMLNGYLAYGFGDNRFKYGGGVIYIFHNVPRTSFEFAYKHDFVQLDESPNAFLEDNILNSLLRRRPLSKLTWADSYKGDFKKEWFTGFSTDLVVNNRTLKPTKYVDFVLKDSVTLSYITTTEVSLNTHFAWAEKFITGKFDRISLGTDYPIIDFNLTWGVPMVSLSDYSYFKMYLSVNHHIAFGPLGKMYYIVTLGKTFGTLPYPLLELHKGNETYAYDDYAFNLMNYYEFISDQYASLSVTHHFNGFFFNKIPLFRRLKWREVVTGKGVVGSLSYANRTFNELPLTMYDLRQPYFESGLGIENILKVIRVDALWRMSYMSNPNISRFGVRVMLVFDF